MNLVNTLVTWLVRGATPPPGPPPDPTPADGRVDVLRVAGVRGVANPRDERFRRFEGLDPYAAPPIPRVRRLAGKFPPLLGRVVLGSVFLGQDGAGWSPREISRALKALIRAGEWIEAEAIRLGAAVNLALLDTYFAAEDPERLSRAVEIAVLPEGDGEGLYDADAEVRLVASAGRAARVLGFRDLADLACRISDRLDADAVVWVVHARASGRSFVVPECDTGMRGLSLAICYAREDDFPNRLVGPPFSDPATLAHEILHLFGASDKYNVSLAAFPAGTVTASDVMRLDTDVLSRLRVDPATAAEIGWGGSA